MNLILTSYSIAIWIRFACRATHGIFEHQVQCQYYCTSSECQIILQVYVGGRPQSHKSTSTWQAIDFTYVSMTFVLNHRTAACDLLGQRSYDSSQNAWAMPDISSNRRSMWDFQCLQLVGIKTTRPDLHNTRTNWRGSALRQPREHVLPTSRACTLDLP